MPYLNDKILFYYLHNHYKNSVEDYKIEKLNIFFRIINSDTTRFKRMYWCLKNEIPMSFKKKIFLIIKG